LPATARSWCWKICLACRPGCRNSSNATVISDPSIEAAIAAYAKGRAQPCLSGSPIRSMKMRTKAPQATHWVNRGVSGLAAIAGLRLGRAWGLRQSDD